MACVLCYFPLAFVHLQDSLAGNQAFVDAIDILPGAREAFPLPSVNRWTPHDPRSKSLAS